jgi:tripartite-type tricarboxylate transporter receptor subunit TctC
VAEFIAYLKESPGKHTFSSGGHGTPAHLLGELFKLETGVQTVHVPYKGNAQIIADLISGINTYQFMTAVAAVEMVRSGKLRGLAAMSHKRVPALPDVPTIAEAGYPKLASEDWAGILVKSGTPAPVVARLNAALGKVLKTDRVREAFAKLGTDPGGGTPESFGALVQAEVGHWARVIKSAGITIDP